MKINTGRGTIPLITLVGIWSVSALTSLPGLAVSPILGQLTTIFPHATELDIQMLTSLPSLLIIPFVLLAGKLAEKRDFVRLLKAGLWMFAASGVLYLFSRFRRRGFSPSNFPQQRGLRMKVPGFCIIWRLLKGSVVKS